MKKTDRTIEEIAKEEKRSYFADYRAKNKDKIKQYNKSYWIRRAEKKLGKSMTNGKDTH